MRLASQILHFFQQPNTANKTSKCMFISVRYRHRTTKNLEEVSVKKSECLGPCTVPRKSIWNIFGSSKKREEGKEKERKPVGQSVEFVTEEQAEKDMQDIAAMGGKVYRTCGTAYIVQTDQLEEPQAPTANAEDEILEEMLKDPSLKGQCDPMPPFQSAELRLIELNERKLHPLYKKLMSIPKKTKPQIYGTKPMPAYKTRSGPVLPEEFPAHLKINREMLEKKNILYEFKRAEPPQQMLARMVEMKNNERPQLIKRIKNKESVKEDYSKK